jgi:branched-chain amino acid aminotransferase
MNDITRGKVLTAARKHDIPAYEKNFSLFDVYGADEAFVTGTFGGLTPVIDIDGRPIGDGQAGPLTRRLRVLYEQEVELAVKAVKAQAD